MDNPDQKFKTDKDVWNFYHDFKAYLLSRLKSPLTIVGLIIILFLVGIAFLTPIIAPFAETFGIYPDPWSPPSAEHPLGKGELGRDLLFLLFWGIRDALWYVLLSNLIGLAGAMLIALIVSSSLEFTLTNRQARITKIILYIIISFILILVFGTIPFYIFGVFLIPIFVMTIINSQPDQNSIVTNLKRGLIYTFFISIYIIILYEFSEAWASYRPESISLGKTINESSFVGQEFLRVRFFAMLTILIMIIGFFLLYRGLKAKGIFSTVTEKGL